MSFFPFFLSRENVSFPAKNRIMLHKLHMCKRRMFSLCNLYPSICLLLHLSRQLFLALVTVENCGGIKSRIKDNKVLIYLVNVEVVNGYEVEITFFYGFSREYQFSRLGGKHSTSNERKRRNLRQNQSSHKLIEANKKQIKTHRLSLALSTSREKLVRSSNRNHIRPQALVDVRKP